MTFQPGPRQTTVLFEQDPSRWSDSRPNCGAIPRRRIAKIFAKGVRWRVGFLLLCSHARSPYPSEGVRVIQTERMGSGEVPLYEVDRKMVNPAFIKILR